MLFRSPYVIRVPQPMLGPERGLILFDFDQIAKRVALASLVSVPPETAPAVLIAPIEKAEIDIGKSQRP